jgi:hypothetical protein
MLRATRILRQKPQLSPDPFTYHTQSETGLWEKVRKAIVVKSVPPFPFFTDERLLTFRSFLQPVSTFSIISSASRGRVEEDEVAVSSLPLWRFKRLRERERCSRSDRRD